MPPQSKVLDALEKSIEHRAFELLSIDLLVRTGYANIIPGGGTNDHGRDAEILYWNGCHHSYPIIAFQFSMQKNWKPKLRSDARKIKSHCGSIQSLVFTTNQTVTTASKDKLRYELCLDLNIELTIFDREWFRVLLEGDHSDLAEKYLGIANDSFPHLSRQKLEQLSRIALQDAAFLQTGAGDTDIHLGDLYTPRKIESEILGNLDTPAAGNNAAPSPIAIVGEAGDGKTSVLWRIGNRLLEVGRSRVFFLKATDLCFGPGSNSGGEISADEIVAGARPPLGSETPSFVLLDTVDLIVRDQARRSMILMLASKLQASDIRLLITCRPLEFRFLASGRSGTAAHGTEEYGSLTSFNAVPLGNYDDEEFQNAVAKHVSRFCRHMNRDESTMQVENLLAAATAGRPIREICHRPLTLRMLFTLYAPDKIPVEIHTFRLYSDYWDFRVKNDRRAGMPDPNATGINFEKATGLIALAMLAERRVDIQEPILVQLLERLHCPAASINTLITRGILHRDHQGFIRFFHQTFFEYSAARGLQLLDPNFVLPFSEKIMTLPNDLFGNTVIEQWLLQDLHSALSPVRNRADRDIAALLNSIFLNSQLSGVYVYSNSTRELPEARKALHHLILNPKQNGGLIKRFVALLPNRALRDPHETMTEVAAIWSHNNWNLTLQLFRFLERYAGQHPDNVISFLNQDDRLHQPIRGASTELILWEILRVCRRIGPRSPNWFWSTFLWMYQKQLVNSGKTEFLPQLIEMIVECSSAIPPGEFRRFLTETVPDDLGPKWGELPPKVARVYAPAWAAMWRRENLSLAQVMEEIDTLPSFSVRFGLAGLADYTSQRGGLDEVAPIIDKFDNEGDPRRANDWLVAFWPKLFTCWTSRQDPSSEGLISQLAERIGQHARNNNGQGLRTLLRTIGDEDFRAMEKSGDSDRLLRALFADNVFSNIDTWTTIPEMRPQLGRCAISGIPAAVAYLGKVLKDPDEFSSTDFRATLVQLATRSEKSKQARWALLSLSLQWNLFEETAQSLDSIISNDETNDLTMFQRNYLLNMCETALSPRGSPLELAQLRIRIACTRQGWLPPLNIEYLLKEIRETAHETRFRFLTELLEEGCGSGFYSIDILLSFDSAPDMRLADKMGEYWDEVLARCLAAAPDISESALRESYRKIVVGSAGIRRLKLFASVLERATSLDPDLALAVLKEFLVSPPAGALGTSAKHALTHRIQAPVSRLFSKCTKNQLGAMVSHIEMIPGVLGASIVRLLSFTHYHELQSEFQELLANPQLDELVRKSLHNESGDRGPATFSNLYHELADHLIAGAS